MGFLRFVDFGVVDFGSPTDKEREETTVVCRCNSCSLPSLAWRPCSLHSSITPLASPVAGPGPRSRSLLIASPSTVLVILCWLVWWGLGLGFFVFGGVFVLLIWGFMFVVLVGLVLGLFLFGRFLVLLIWGFMVYGGDGGDGPLASPRRS